MTEAKGWLVFDGVLGCGAIVWSSAGITHVHFAEPSAARLRGRLAKAHGAAAERRPPSAISSVVRRLQQHVRGRTQRFDDVRLDLAGASAFARRIYETLRAVPAGQTISYAELGERAGYPRAARAVGGAVARNPLPIVVPCHRVLGAGGRLGGFSAPGGTATKAELLALEGASARLPRSPREAPTRRAR